jgi:plasmid maintenance system antidote protein VapI
VTEYRWSLSFPKYQAGDDGSILGRNGITRSAFKNDKGYWHIAMHRDGVRFNPPVHFVVCEAWHGPRPEGMQVAHDDGNKDNNAPVNLLWKTQIDNDADKDRHGTRARGERNGFAVLSEQDVEIIRQTYGAGGISHLQLAQLYSVSEATIQRVVVGTYWKHADGPIQTNTHLLLTNELVKKIRQDYEDNSGLTMLQLAARHGVSKSNVHRIIRREIWKNV